MRNKLSNFLIALVIGILAMEMSRLAFHLMNQSDSLLFYLGFSIIALEIFVGGWYLVKFLNKKFPTEKNDEESK
jgi:hydrogenase/urease accessory protein HupE